MAMTCSWWCWALCLLCWEVRAQDQSWSEQTYLHVSHTMTCNDTTANITFSDDDWGVWRRLGSDQELATGTDYDLSSNNIILTIRNVTDDMEGIYVCDVVDKSGKAVFHAIRGVNIGEHLYHDLLDKYRTSLIRGAITTVCVVGIVVGICLVDRFRYLSEEQKEKRSNRKQRAYGSFPQSQSEGRDNPVMVHDVFTVDPAGYNVIKTKEVSTRF